MNKKKVLIGSPVYQKPEILASFLASLKNLKRDSVSLDYMFVDDNIDETSSKLLTNFKREGSEVLILSGKEQVNICAMMNRITGMTI